MAERFIRQSDFMNAVYMPNCPIALEKGAVLLDTKTDTYMLQLKFANIGTTGIAFVRVSVEALDNVGNPAYQEITTSYDEITAADGTFGTKKLLLLPNNNATTFRVYVTKVTTVDGKTHTFSGEQHMANTEMRDIVAERRVEKAKKRERQAQHAKALWGVSWYQWLLAVNAVVLLLFSTWGILSHFARPGLWDIAWDAHHTAIDAFPWWVRADGGWYWSVRLVPDVVFPTLRSHLWFDYDVSIGYSRIFTPVVLLLLFFWCLWFSAWKSVRTPRILKCTAIMAIFMPVGYFLLDAIIAGWLWTAFGQHTRDMLSFRDWLLPHGRVFFWDSFYSSGLSLAVFFLIFAIPFISIFINARRHDKSLKLSRALMFWLPPQEGKKSEQ
jgi:hypothetical protein